MNFRQAAARFSAEVERALTRARRAARDARAESSDFRRCTDELSAQAKTGKLKGLRRSDVAPTDPAAHAEATKFRANNGLPVADVPTADELIAGLPGRERPPRTPENDDFSQHQVLFDVDKEVRQPLPAEPDRIDSQEREDRVESTRPSDSEDDFSHQRILMDATEETYRPGEVHESAFDLDDPYDRR
jgi:hypothetical protein